ncbi:MAG: dethiobiotin synthase [Candidatus Omnitrophota bacterium]|nr:dethiobiotin synthase [Candidatus Omnitrophota bacterium]
MTKGIFVTGTDTGVGKTVVTKLLARYLRESGSSCIRQKWIETGISFSPEVSSLRRMRLLYAFKFAASPHLASQKEKKRISPARIIKSYKLLAQEFDTFDGAQTPPFRAGKDCAAFSINPEQTPLPMAGGCVERVDFVIVEGTGGVLVPINKKSLIIDIAKKLNLPVLIVVQNRLGAINHTLLTIEALRSRKLKILGLVFSNVKKENRLILEDNPKIIKVLSGENIFGILPWERKAEKLYKKFIPIGKNIVRGIKKRSYW